MRRQVVELGISMRTTQSDNLQSRPGGLPGVPTCSQVGAGGVRAHAVSPTSTFCRNPLMPFALALDATHTKA